LVLHVTHAIHAQIGVALTKKHGPHSNTGIVRLGIIYREVKLTHVVYQPRYRKDVKCAQGAILNTFMRRTDQEKNEGDIAAYGTCTLRVIMVAVD